MDHKHNALLQAVKPLEKAIARLRRLTRSDGRIGAGVALLKAERDLRHIMLKIRAGSNPEEVWISIQELLSRVSILLLALMLEGRHS